MILELKDVRMQFQSGDSVIRVLEGVNLAIEKGESVALVGPSGCGKSTLLNIAALLEQPTSGDVSICNECATLPGVSDDAKTKIRRNNIGFVYQFHNLLPEFTALENVMIPQMIQGNVSRREAHKRSRELLDQVELGHRVNQTPKRLSGGEQQRVAIARALANRPNIIIADEPTGNLDSRSSELVFALFLKLIKDNQTSLLMATHNMELALRLDRVTSLSNGLLI